MGAKNSRKFEFKLGKTGMIVFVLGLSFLVFFSFLLGVRVGKHIEVYPEKLAGGVPEMIKDTLGLSSVMQDARPLSVPSTGSFATDEEKKDFDLTFYETLGGKSGIAGSKLSDNEKKEKSLSDQSKRSAAADVKTSGTKPAARPDKKDKNTVAALPSAKEAEKPAQVDIKKTERKPAAPAGKKVESPVVALQSAKENKKAAPTDVRKTASKPSAPAKKNADSAVAALPSTTAANKKKAALTSKSDLTKPGLHQEKGKCLVQVVSFPEKSKAEGVSKKLAAMGYKPRVVAADIPGKGKWFRVVLTGYNSRQDAQKVSDRIAKSVSGVNCVVLAE